MWPPIPKPVQGEVLGAQGLPQRPKAAQQHNARPQPLPAPQMAEAPVYEDHDEEDMEEESSRVGLANVPDWMLVRRPRGKRMHDIDEDEEEMGMEAPVDEVREAVESLPTKLMRSDRPKDHVKFVLIKRLLSQYEKDEDVHRLIDCTRALVEGKEDAWGEELNISEVVMHMHLHVPRTRPKGRWRRRSRRWGAVE